VTIPVDLTNAALSPHSSLKKSSSSQNELDQIPSNRTYGVKINPKENVIHYIDPYVPQRPSSNYTKRSIPDLPSMTTVNRPSTAHSLERSVNELRINMSVPCSSQPQKKVTIQLGENIPPQRITRFEISINELMIEDYILVNNIIHHFQKKLILKIKDGLMRIKENKRMEKVMVVVRTIKNSKLVDNQYMTIMHGMYNKGILIHRRTDNIERLFY
jgi:hypothetical protein